MKKLMIAAAIVCAAAANVYGMMPIEIECNSYIKEYIRDAQGELYTGPMPITCEALGYSIEVYAEDGDCHFIDDSVSCTEDTDYTFVLTAATPTHTYLETKTDTATSFGTNFRFDNTGTWTAAPEPTSGLLMLLGLAGLSLKRRRA